jgi:serine O-acetyltransferase
MSDSFKIASALFETKSQFHKANSTTVKNFDKHRVEDFLQVALDIVFPAMLRKTFHDVSDLYVILEKHTINLSKLLGQLGVEQSQIEIIVADYCDQLLPISELLKKDAISLFEGDPAASCVEEILLCYPGLFAVATYRLSHLIFQYNKILPRIMSEIAHEKTGIDIHPGASIGHAFFIDHGTGVVIGETAHIGNNVKIYQGVTLGALSVDKKLNNIKRHPTIEDDCIIYSNATILGGETVIGHGSIIGGNVWMTKSVPPHSLVYHKSEVKFDQIKKTNNEDFFNEEELNYEI